MVPLTLALSDELFKKLDEKARQHNISITALIAEILQAYVDDEDKSFGET